MLILDTCALIFDALAPERLSTTAASTIDEAAGRNDLAIADISLWEVAMLAAHRRLDPREPVQAFLGAAILRRRIAVLPITPEIAQLAVSHPGFKHKDPADRLIGATALANRSPIVTCDGPLSECKGLSVIW